MPSVSPMKYGAPSLDQVLQLVAGLAQQRQQIQQQAAPQTPQAAAPQTELQGLVSGLLAHNIQQRQQAQAQEGQYLSQALALLNAIPDDEQNTPLKLQLATAFMNTKPGKKNIFQELFDPQADHSYQAQLLQQLAAKMPSQQERAVQQGDLSQATRPRTVADAGADYTPTSQKFHFPDEGKYQAGPVIQTADGLQQVLIDQRTGEVKLQQLGQGLTEKQSVAGIRAQGGAGDATRRQEQGIARALAAKDGINLDKLPTDDPLAEAYTLQAREHIARYKDAQLQSTELTPQLKTAKTQEALANAGRGGLSAGQAATISRQDRQDVNKAQAELADAQSELKQAQTEMDGIWNGWKGGLYGQRTVNGQRVPVPDQELEQYMQLFDKEGVQKFRQLRAKRDAAQVKVDAAKKRAQGLGTPNRVAGAASGVAGRGQVLDLDRVLGQEQRQPTPDQQYLDQEYYIDDETTPPVDQPLRSLARVYGDKKMFLINPQGFGLQAGSVRKGQTINSSRGNYLVLAVSSDGSKVLARKK